MKAIIQNVISFLKQGVNLVPDSSTENTQEVFISGYSTTSCDNQRCVLCRRPVGILYADVVDYSRLTEQDEEGTHHRLVEGMKIMEANVAANDGRIAHYAGDAILAEFKDADSALRCAINVQLAARQWNANLGIAEQVLFRIGVNFGDVIADQGDIFGNAVNLTARLEKLARSGSICVSESVRQRLEDHPSFKFIAMGKQYLKNIREPVQAFWIEIDAQHIVDPDLAGVVKISAVAS